jgi:hypothetical protein
MLLPPKPPPTTKTMLTRLVLAAVVFVWLAISCFRTVDPDLRVLVGILAAVAFLGALLFGIDAGKAINRDPAAGPRLRLLGVILVFPLAAFGILFIAAGLVLLFVSVRSIEMEACEGQFAAMAAARFFVGFFMPLGGYGMLREGLRRNPQFITVIQRGSKELTVASVPLWLRILMLTDGIAIGTSVVSFAVLAASTSCDNAGWIWSPRASILITIAAAALAMRIFVLRRRRASQNPR